MKKIMFKTAVLAIMLFIAGNTFAQDSKQTTPPKKQATADARADRELKKMTTELSLTADESPKVREVLLTAIKQHDADKVTANGDAAKEKELDEKRAKVKRESLKPILTPDQFKKLEEMWKEHKETGKTESK